MKLFSILKKQLSRPGASAAAGNFGWLVMEKGIRLALGVCVGFWMARYLGPARLGTLSYCTAIITLMGIIPSLGLDEVIKRDLLQRPDNAAEVLTSSAIMRLAVGVAMYALLAVVGWFRWGLTQDEAKLIVIMGGLLLQPALIVPDLWLQARLLARWSVTAQVVALFFGASLRIIIILTDGTIFQFAGVTVFEMVLMCGSIGLAARHKGLDLRVQTATLKKIFSLMAEAWPLLFASLAIVIYMRVDEIMLRHMAGPSAVGVYAAAARLSELWYFLPTALASSLLPAMLRARAQSDETYTARLQQQYDLGAGIAYALSIPVALAAPMIVKFTYGDSYAAAGPILSVHIWSSVFVFLGVVRGQWLVNERLTGFYLVATIAGAVVNVTLNLLFIPRWAGLGAAYATVFAYAFAAWLSSYFYPAVRRTAGMQTRSLLLPLTGWRYLKRS